VQLASSCEEKLVKSDLFGINQGKTEKVAWTTKARSKQPTIHDETKTGLSAPQ
jgi:hypothetical protein